MKTTMSRTLALTAILLSPLALAVGCAHEVSHSESDKPNWSGGRTHEETTVYQNPDGTKSTSHEKTKTSD